MLRNTNHMLRLRFKTIVFVWIFICAILSVGCGAGYVGGMQTVRRHNQARLVTHAGAAHHPAHIMPVAIAPANAM